MGGQILDTSLTPPPPPFSIHLSAVPLPRNGQNNNNTNDDDNDNITLSGQRPTSAVVDDSEAAELLGADFRGRNPSGASGGVVLPLARRQARARRISQHRQGEADGELGIRVVSVGPPL